MSENKTRWPIFLQLTTHKDLSAYQYKKFYLLFVIRAITVKMNGGEEGLPPAALIC